MQISFLSKLRYGFFLFSLILPVTAAEEEGLSYEVIIDPQYEDAFSFSEGLAVVGTLGEYPTYDGATAPVYFWSVLDKQGKTVIPFEYDALGTFLEGLAFACKDGKYGVIDTQNNVVIPFEYTRITSYSNGLAVAVKDGRAFCVDRYGKEVPGSDTISQESYFPAGLESSLTMTPDEIITVIENGKYGFVRIGYTQPLPQEGEMADWAYEEVIQAIQHDLVPSDLQNQYYANITRGDFATEVQEATHRSRLFAD